MNQREIKDLLIAWLVISFAFAAVMSNGIGAIFSIGFLLLLAAVLIGVGTGFIFHELGHRTVAIRFGAHAEFRRWDFGLMLALFLGIASLFTGFGFIFAAPGAVYIYKEYMTLKENGLISAVGPLINIVIGLAFFAGFYFVSSIGLQGSFFGLVFSMGAYVNLFLALFNLIPFGPLDGSKVMRWNPLVWAAMFFPLVAWYLFF